MAPIRKRWTPNNWASLKPFGIGEQRPNNYLEILRALGENRGELSFAWRILTQGVCDGCALGTTGLRDWTLPGVHLCNIRLRLLKLNTMPAFDVVHLADVNRLRTLSSAELRDLGRLPYPMIRRRGEPGFRRITWDKALGLAADRISATEPRRFGVYLTSRGMPNEAYYAVQKAVRAMGSNNVDNAARVCHAPSTAALKHAVGAAATTCSYSDWLDADLIVFFGSNVANNQPVATKYLHYAKKNGARVVLVNTYREPGMERYWIPSVMESALFGTKLADDCFLIDTGGDIPFINGVLKYLFEGDGVDRDFIAGHTEGAEALEQALSGMDWESLERGAGTDRGVMERCAREVARAEKAVFVWSMGVTQHECGMDNVKAICNLALTKGFVGRPGCGLMPIRGHSGVQGGAEMGAYATVFPGGVPIDGDAAGALSAQWGFAVPDEPGLTAPEMIDAAHDGVLDALIAVGGNFLEVLPEPEYVREALGRIPLRVHMDIVVSSQMLEEPGDTVILLPAATRYETRGGVTQTSTERRVIFSPEIPGRRIGEARPEWEVFLELGRRVKPERADALRFDSTGALREEIARVIPQYDGIQHLKARGDEFQYGGARLCEGWNFPTATGKARFAVVKARETEIPEGMFRVSTRRGKQFNSMVQEKKDALTGAVRRAVLISREDAGRLGIGDGDAVVLRNALAEFHGTARIAAVKAGNLQIHWPEGNVLIDRRRREAGAGIPDYNAVVELVKG